MSRQKLLVTALVVALLGGGAYMMWGGGLDGWDDYLLGRKMQAAKSAPRPVVATPVVASTTPAPIVPTVSKTTLIEELPRQAMLIAAAQLRTVPTGDRSVDFTGVTKDVPLTCDVSLKRGEHVAKVTIHDAPGTEVRSIDWPAAALADNYPDYGKLAITAESWIDKDFVPMLAQAAAGPGGTPPSVDAIAAAALPPEVEPLLGMVDPQSSFLAARALHKAIAESGESPQRLAALVRAYANLGDSTRYLYSRHGSVFFARAILYAERLTRKYPEVPLAHAARAYAYTLLGEPAEARPSFDKARQLATAAANAQLPEWAELAEDLNHFRTGRLFIRTDKADPEAALASYFAFLSVEHSRMTSAVMNLARLALTANPGALRVVNVMNGYGGVASESVSSEGGPLLHIALLSKLRDTAGVPEAVKAAVGTAKAAGFTPASIVGLLAKMDAQPGEPSQLLPWGTYASVTRDALFVSGFRRLFFASQYDGGNPSRELEQLWWPLLKDHRFGPVLAGFDQSGQLGAPLAAVMATHVGENDLATRMPHLIESAKPLQGGKPWNDRYDYVPDDTVYDEANRLCAYGFKEADSIAILSLLNGITAESLAAVCPDHPSALSQMIVNAWPKVKPRAAQIEKDFGGNPQIAFALARAYRSEGRADDALALLQKVVELSPDLEVYEELAEVYKVQGNDDKWLAIYEKYFSSTEDFGLDHAKKQEEIAYTLMGMKKPARALKYARDAAGSAAAWGLRVYAMCLTEMGRYPEAEKVAQQMQESYPDSFAWYRWCQITGKGDLGGARRKTDATLPAIEAGAPPAWLMEVAVVHEMEGRVDQAHDCWVKVTRQQIGAYQALQLALNELERGNPKEAATALETTDVGQIDVMSSFKEKFGNVALLGDMKRLAAYKAAIEEVQNCLDDPKAVPSRSGNMQQVLDATDKPYRATIAYSLGRLCEIRGKKEDAAWWYRTSLETREWTNISRPQAAASLRRLGQEYYK